MKIGIFGSTSDAQCQALRMILETKGVDVITVESQGLNQGVDAAFDGERFTYDGKPMDAVNCWYLRYIMSPLPPCFERNDHYYLYADWFTDYMHRRERFGFQLSWLLSLSLSGIPVINPPEHGGVVQLKPFQLHAARMAGLQIPETLITNNPTRVREFARRMGDVIYKPSMGGSICHVLDEEALQRLDTIVASPVIFQEKVKGRSIRLTIIGNELVSAVSIPSSSIDYRSDPLYSSGRQVYENLEVPENLVEKCCVLMRNCGLLFSGVDFILKDDGTFVFLESNSSPIYLDIEQKTGVPITMKLADYMLRLANEPKGYHETIKQATRAKSFIAYAFPFNPNRTTFDS
jgi:glutathione synthase/RimK-type ligase-like ATP-grasp enzyme